VFRACSPAVHVLTAIALLCSMVGPPEHVHEADATHHTSVIHRHMEAHGHDATSVNDDDGHIVWLDPAAIQQGKTQVVPPTAILVGPVSFPCHGVRWSIARREDTARAHGPPRLPKSLRGPPFLHLS
jgi:hypothetical protein